MPESDSDTTHYIGILEGVVALLAINAGMNPNVLMANAIVDLTKAAGMDTVSSDALIQSRWTNRHFDNVGAIASSVSLHTAINRSPENERPPDPEPAPPMAERVKAYRDRQNASAATTFEGDLNPKSVVSQQDSESGTNVPIESTPAKSGTLVPE